MVKAEGRRRGWYSTGMFQAGLSMPKVGEGWAGPPTHPFSLPAGFFLFPSVRAPAEPFPVFPEEVPQDLPGKLHLIAGE